MTLFAVCVAVLIALAWWALRPVWRTPPVVAETGGAQLAVLGEQLAELDAELAAGQLDAERHRAARVELQRRMLEEGRPAAGRVNTARSRSVAAVVSVLVPASAIALYMLIGNPGAITPQPAAAGAPSAGAEHDMSPEAMQAMLDGLARRLEKSTGPAAADLPGWTMLARSYTVLQRFADADRAFARAIAIAPDDAQLLADRADVLAMLQGQHLAGEPEQLIAKALAIEPRNLKALALAGSAAFERSDLVAAKSYWSQARALAPAGDEFSAGLDRSLNDVRIAMGEPPAATASSPAPAAAGAARIGGRVSLAPAVAARAAPTDTVFVFARAAQGPRMPLAIVRRTVADLPFSFTLDDSQAMSPQMKLSSVDQVVVGARISRSGNAMPQSGDLHVESAAIGTRVDGLDLVIDSVQPS